jgi:hypothetical protein
MENEEAAKGPRYLQAYRALMAEGRKSYDQWLFANQGPEEGTADG